MARAPDKEKFLAKIPEQFRGLLRSESDFNYVSNIWKLSEDIVRTLMPSIPDKLKPIFDWKINKPVGKRGNRSNLPYDTDTVKLTSELMKLNPGATVAVEGGVRGNLLTVQVLVKLDINGTTKTVSISNIDHVESKR